MKVVDLFDPRRFVQHLTSDLIKNPSFTLPITRLVKQHVQVAVADEAKFHGKSVDLASQDGGANPPSPLTEMF